MTMAGLISHMRWTEHIWLEVLFLGGDKKQNPAGDQGYDTAAESHHGTAGHASPEGLG